MLGLLLVGATLAVYAQVWRFEFVDFDDPVYVVTNLHVTRGLSADGFDWAFAGFHDANWIPLTWLSLMLDATLYGTWPGGFHITNLLFHTANVLLLFATLTSATQSSLKSACVAALFAVHPLHVESVAWVAERKDMLSIFFGLLSLFMYVRFVQRRRWLTLALAIGFYLCSLMSKQTLVTLPFVFLLLDYWPLGRLSVSSPFERAEARPPRPQSIGTRWAELVVEKIPFFVASAVFSVLAALAQSEGGAVLSITGIPHSIRILNAILAYGLYVRRAIFPVGLAPFYPHPGNAISLAGVGLSFVFLTAVTVAAIVYRRSRPYLLVGWLWFLGTLVPLIGLVQIGNQQMADRYVYFPLIGLDLAVVWVVSASIPAALVQRHGPAALAIGVVTIFAVVAFVQAAQWHDGARLFRHTLAVTSDNAYAHQGLASALFRRGQFEESREHLQHAIKLNPGDPVAHHLLGRDLQALGRTDEAVQEYRAALAIDDGLAGAHNDLGLVLSSRRQYPEAAAQFQRAISFDGDLAEAYVNLGTAYAQMGDYEKCIEYSKRALQLAPALVGCRRNIAVCLAARGRYEEAIDQLKVLLAASPGDADARSELERITALRNQKPASKGSQPQGRSPSPREG